MRLLVALEVVLLLERLAATGMRARERLDGRDAVRDGEVLVEEAVLAEDLAAVRALWEREEVSAWSSEGTGEAGDARRTSW